MKDLLKKALSGIVTFEDDKKSVQSQVKASPPPVASSPLPVFKTQPTITIDQAEFEKFQSHFEELMNQANLPGPDYYEFLKVEDSLAKHIPDERTRFLSAFASLAVQGLTKEILLSSAAQYIDILEKDRAGFEDVLKKKIEAEIGGRKTQIADSLKQIESLNEQIQALGKQIVEIQAQVNDLTSQTESIEKTFRKNAEGFAMAHNAMLQTIQTDVQKIQSIL